MESDSGNYCNQEQFKLNKRNALSKLDKSKKGEIDDGIKQLLGIINSSSSYFTTSSCSGRIVLLEIGSAKNGNSWLYCSHNSADYAEIKSALLQYKGKNDIWLRAEPAILHVCARDTEKADSLLQIFRENGFKHSGIISLKSKIMLEIQNTDGFAAIVAKNGKIIISDDYLKALTAEANSNISKTKSKLKKLEKLLFIRKECATQ